MHPTSSQGPHLMQCTIRSPFANRAVLLVAAHPDDETLFAGSQLAVCQKLWIVHVTDGAPSKGYARALGFRTRAGYAEARRTEFRAALRAGGVQAECWCFACRDQYSCLNLVSLSRKLAVLIKEIRPDLILTHPYEGGNRDHDSVAFIVRLAAEFCDSPPSIWEMACYHVQNGETRSHVFPGEQQSCSLNIELNTDQQEAKREMLRCFTSQRDAIAQFSSNREAFRPAPVYEFARPPIDGRLGYESNEFGVESALWCLLALSSRQALSGSIRGRCLLSLIRPAMWLMIKTSRCRRLYRRFTDPLERALVRFCAV
jgi:LmbE family N-acetylglucosaminyl deacetylase